MEASILVVEFILQHKELLTKPFIVIPTQDYEDSSWTAFVAVNCGKTGKNEKDTKCGYFLFDPTGKRHPTKPPPICGFFLKLVHFVLSPENDEKARAQKSPKKKKGEAHRGKTRLLHHGFAACTSFTLVSYDKASILVVSSLTKQMRHVT